ncbi:LOW QUALITY PROTEIN: RING finger protein 122 [Sylvia borin]
MKVRCSCSPGLTDPTKPCTMPPGTFQDLPLIYTVIFGIGVFIFVLSLTFCCYFISELRHRQSERFGYKEVLLKGDAQKLNGHGPTCAVCLEGFRAKEELAVPAQEVLRVCPTCNNPTAGPGQPRTGTGTLPDELV